MLRIGDKIFNKELMKIIEKAQRTEEIRNGNTTYFIRIVLTDGTFEIASYDSKEERDRAFLGVV